MTDLRSELARLINRATPRDGVHESPLPGTQCVKISRATTREKGYWGSSLCIVAQGTKEILLGRQLYRFDDLHYFATPIDLPVIGRVTSVSAERPFLCLRIALDPIALRQVDAQLAADCPPARAGVERGVFVGSVGNGMLAAAVRLAGLFATPEDGRVLGPLVVQEILYHLLKGADGAPIRQFLRSGSATHRVAQAIYTLSSELGDEVDVEALAKAANMSRSSFFRHFKEVTSMSPIQYQKRLRLLEARRLMVEEGESAEGSGFRVGYKSASQFSREYSRMFGTPPSRDLQRIRRPA